MDEASANPGANPPDRITPAPTATSAMSWPWKRQMDEAISYQEAIRLNRINPQATKTWIAFYQQAPE